MDADEILKKVANEHSYETWGELMYDTHEHSQIEYTKEVMFIYAEGQVKNLQQSLFIGMLVCPFCKDTGYDKEGLKTHLENRCKEYGQTNFL